MNYFPFKTIMKIEGFDKPPPYKGSEEHILISVFIKKD